MAREVTLRFIGDAGNLNRTFAAVDAQAARTMGSLQNSVATASATMTSKFSNVGASVAAAGVAMRRSGARMARNVSLPLAAIGGLGIKTAIDYERSMNVLQAVSGATGEQMASFGRLAQELGGDITLPGTSAADATAAMVELAKAGLSIEDSMGAAKGVLQLSAAGGLDNATAALVAANALNAFKLEGSQAVRVADLLAGAANGSSAEVAELADSLAQGASVFAQAGIPIEDFVSSAALLANVGIKGSDAGTSLKSMLLKLQSPTAAAAKQIAGLGVDIYDAQGQMRPFADIIGSFTGAMSGMTQEARDAALGDIFGSDAVRAANAVLLAGVPAFESMKRVTTEQGAAAKLAGARNKGLGGALDGLKSAMETLALKVLVPALPVLTRFVTALANFLPKLTAIPKPILIAAAAFAGLLVSAGPLLAIFGAMLSPLGLLAGAMAVVGVAIFAALNPEKAGAIVNKIKEKWNELSPGMFAALGRLWETVTAWLATNGPAIASQVWKWAQAFIGWVAPMIPPLLAKLGTLLGAIGTWLLDVAVPWIGDKLKTTWIPAFVNWVVEMTPKVIAALHEFLKQVITWIVTEAVPKIAAAIAGLAADIANGFAKALGDLLPGGDKKITVNGKTYSYGGAAPGAPAPRPPGAPAPFDAAGGGDWKPMGRKPVAMARGGLLLGLNRPTPILAGEGRGKEDVLAVPHSKGGIGGLGGVTQTNHFHGISYEEAAQRSDRQLAWRLALTGRR